MRRAFTLVELMISVMMVLIMALGVGAVFRWTGQTINAGQTNSTAMRSYRAAMSIMTQDFRGCVPDSPVFVIHSTRTVSYLSAAEKVRGASGYVRPGTTPYPAADASGFDYRLQFDYNYPRLHRADIVRFFSRGLFRRQTANEGEFTRTTTSSEAFISYGHVKYLHYLADGNVVKWAGPDGGYLASDWALGRSVVLLKDKAALPSDEIYLRRVSDTNPAPYVPGQVSAVWPWYSRDWQNLSAGLQPTFNLSPLCPGSPASSHPDDASEYSRYITDPDQIQDSRYDIADTSIDGYRQIVATAKARQALFPLAPPATYPQEVQIVRWWHPLIFSSWYTNLGQSFGGGHPRFALDNGRTTNPPVYWAMFAGVTWFGTNDPAVLPWRFGCERRVSIPLTSTKAARAVPYFLQNCSQFGVEYAGDFLTQDASGIVTKAEPDGVIDFLVRTVGGTAVRETRWYGMPRDINSDDGKGPDGIIKGWQPGRTAQDMLDVVPLRDIVRTAPGCNTRPADPENPGNNYYYGMPHEKDVEGLFMPPLADYGAGSWTWVGGPYVCVWTNDVPAMIRIWMQVDDPSDRVQVGQRLELVFKLK